MIGFGECLNSDAVLSLRLGGGRGGGILELKLSDPGLCNDWLRAATGGGGIEGCGCF